MAREEILDWYSMRDLIGSGIEGVYEESFSFTRGRKKVTVYKVRTLINELVAVYGNEYLDKYMRKVPEGSFIGINRVQYNGDCALIFIDK